MATDNNMELEVLDEGTDNTEEVPTCCAGNSSRA